MDLKPLPLAVTKPEDTYCLALDEGKLYRKRLTLLCFECLQVYRLADLKGLPLFRLSQS